MKTLDKMTTEELGKLFPVIVADYCAVWPLSYLGEKRRILDSLQKFPVCRIDHVGSTAIPDLAAKPVIDIVLQFDGKIEKSKLVAAMKDMGYHLIIRKDNPPPHMMFVKGYSLEGYDELCFHIHIRKKGPCREILFKEFLIHHPHYAREYEKLKRELARKHKYNRELYTQGKEDFIQSIMAKAAVRPVTFHVQGNRR